MSRPMFSSDVEDTRSEVTALAIDPDDVVVCVCAGAGRALSLLGETCARFIVADVQVPQLFVLELKAAAMAGLAFDDYRRFNGVGGTGEERLDLYAGLRGSLSEPARVYWDRRRRLVREGIYTAGRIDRMHIGYVAFLRRLGKARAMDRLIGIDGPDAFREALTALRPQFEAEVRAYSLLLHPLVVFAVSGDPSYFKVTEERFSRQFARRFLAFVERTPASHSFMARTYVEGRLRPHESMPIHMTPDGFAKAKANLGRLTWFHGPVQRAADRIHRDDRVKWSISDISCWLTEPAFQQLQRDLMRVGAAGSRICSRNFGAARPILATGERGLRRLDDLCAFLDDRDNAFLYRFEIGEYGGETAEAGITQDPTTHAGAAFADAAP